MKNEKPQKNIKVKEKPLKNFFKNMEITFGVLLLIICCTFLIILSTFVQLDIIHFILPMEIFKGVKLNYSDFLYTYKIIPQIPVVMFVGAFLGRKYGITCIILYILLGLFVMPVFALGGGPHYVLEYGFGYILAYIPAVFFMSSILKSGFSNRNIIHSILVGVLTIHIIGILYMLFIAGLMHEGREFVIGWICAQSGAKIAYDMVLSFATVFLAKYLKVIAWAVK